MQLNLVIPRCMQYVEYDYALLSDRIVHNIRIICDNKAADIFSLCRPPLIRPQFQSVDRSTNERSNDPCRFWIILAYIFPNLVQVLYFARWSSKNLSSS